MFSSLAISRDPDKMKQEVRQKISTFEEGIKQVHASRTGLTRNANEVQWQVRSTVTRLMETLRNRELWLLGQIESIQHAKEETLNLRLNNLNQAIGLLRAVVRFTEDGNVDASFLEGKLNQCLDRLDELCNEIDEHQVVLKADTHSLRDAIRGFGSIESLTTGAKFNQDMVFANPELKSCCLPSRFEDYGDGEQQLLHKPVSDPCNIRISFPKLSARKEDWLLPSAVASSNSTPMDESPVHRQTLSSVGRVSPASLLSEDSGLSIQQWLRQIKREPEPEPMDDIEMISSIGRELNVPHLKERQYTGTTDDFEVIPFSSSETSYSVASSCAPTYFKEVLSSPISKWLVQAHNLNPTASFHRLQYFQKAGENWERWLPKGSNNQVIKEDDETCGRNIKDGRMEKTDENRFPYFQQIISGDVNMWLRPSKMETDAATSLLGSRVPMPLSDDMDGYAPPSTGQEEKQLTAFLEKLSLCGNDASKFRSAFAEIANSPLSDWLHAKSMQMGNLATVADGSGDFSLAENSHCERDAKMVLTLIHMRNILESESSDWLPGEGEDRKMCSSAHQVPPSGCNAFEAMLPLRKMTASTQSEDSGVSDPWSAISKSSTDIWLPKYSAGANMEMSPFKRPFKVDDWYRSKTMAEY